MIVLAIETSCDESAVAIMDDKKNILANIIKSQINIHEKYGGVVPELAARSHAEIIDKLILIALKEADLNFKDIDIFAATCGPGLIGGVIIGMMAAKTLASIHRKPFLAINHLEGHILSAKITNKIKYPFLQLLVSGGHCQILRCNKYNNYTKIGETIDDAIGESFDKVAKMLGYKYPGGPVIEQKAKEGNEDLYKFPKPLIDNKNHNHLCDFSLSGLKTAVRRKIEEEKTNIKKDQIEYMKKNIAASFQKTIKDIIINRLENALKVKENNEIKKLIISGGVAANKYIITNLKNWAHKKNFEIISPPINLCTDNAAMIAWAAIEKYKYQKKGDSIKFKPQARWQPYN
ncbi:MAG: tRNA (adenosine(37)-N6)-threonylcarbamoyltransferase complex transferase subunit TsaD [Rickettsiales bacterium]|nr:tRNA (adenosine(37)-N6)-threonylcarbamoyltransferase complex transferase subunit TsaD [Rickettsiales bacterium]|tara:strand:- start:434 stop:1474 length:1041 start_codon:yes stop_codon:yes gene_type:complete